MEYIDLLGNKKTVQNTTNYLTINDNNDIVNIIGFSKILQNIVISNNKNLKSIKSFPKALVELYVMNNENLESINIPPITKKFVAYNNPKIANFEKLVDDYKNTTYYKYHYPDIITEPDEIYPKNVIVGMELDNPDLQIDDWTFTTNIEEYQKSPSYLQSNDSKYLISYKEYDGYSYPVVTIPEGTILYNYSKGNNLSFKEKYHNLYNLEEGDEFESQLKFFYPVPYAAKLGIDADYNICNIVVTTNDIKIICLVSPAPQSNETLRLFSENKVINNKVKRINYYDNGLTNPCEIYDHDLCLDPKMMKQMNVQGYMCISNDDSISNGETWYKNMNKESMKNYKEYIEEYLFNSCLSSIYKDNNNLDYINEKLNINLPDNIKNRMFGIPEIVLVPLKTDYFYTVDQEKITKTFNNPENERLLEIEHSEIRNMFKTMFNYSVIEICGLSELKQYLERIEKNILTNKQCPVLQLLSKYLTMPELASNLRYEKLNFDDLNYTLAYLKKNTKNPYCAFETIGYHLLQIPSVGRNKTLKNRLQSSRRTISNRKPIKKPKSVNRSPSSKHITIKGGGTNNKIVFERTRGGIPIAYTIPG